MNVQNSRSVLKANWLSTSGVARMQVLGADLVLEGPITLDGVTVTGLAGGGRTARYWASGVTHLRAPGSGIEVAAGESYLQNCRVHSSINDASNNSSGPTAPTHGLQFEIACTFTGAGAINHQGTSVSQNRNAASAHGGQHHVAFSSVYRGSHGPDCADTSANGYASVSWLVGCKSEGSSASGNANFALGSASTGSRSVFMDSCVSSGGTTFGLINANPANTTIKTFGCTFSGGTSGTVATYRPDAPA